MAKKSMIERENKRAQLVAKYGPRRAAIKLAIKQAELVEDKMSLQSELQALPLNSSPCRLHNRCAITGRPKGYYRDFGLSRHELRSMAHRCLLPGVTKSSW
jgi:small subunit ribosomal protein S14